jgi:cytochrome c biogenesis protein ResB
VLLHYDRARLDLRRDRGFAVRLERFDEGRDPGGMRSASYASEVAVLTGDGERRQRITMNEPLHIGGVTIYQTAFRPEIGEDGMPTGRQTSIFTVAEDPGRWLKYAGSALIVAGMMLLWWFRPRRSAPTPAQAQP